MANFQTAIDALKRGDRVARRGWRNGFLFLACGLDFFTTADLSSVYDKTGGQCSGKGDDATWHYDCGPAWDRRAICFCPKRKDRGTITVGWLPKFDDIFAEDWYIVRTKEDAEELAKESDETENEEVNETEQEETKTEYSEAEARKDFDELEWLFKRILPFFK